MMIEATDLELEIRDALWWAPIIVLKTLINLIPNWQCISRLKLAILKLTKVIYWPEREVQVGRERPVGWPHMRVVEDWEIA